MDAGAPPLGVSGAGASVGRVVHGPALPGVCVPVSYRHLLLVDFSTGDRSAGGARVAALTAGFDPVSVVSSWSRLRRAWFRQRAQHSLDSSWFSVFVPDSSSTRLVLLLAACGLDGAAGVPLRRLRWEDEVGRYSSSPFNAAAYRLLSSRFTSRRVLSFLSVFTCQSHQWGKELALHPSGAAWMLLRPVASELARYPSIPGHILERTYPLLPRDAPEARALRWVEPRVAALLAASGFPAGSAASFPLFTLLLALSSLDSDAWEVFERLVGDEDARSLSVDRATVLVELSSLALL